MSRIGRWTRILMVASPVVAGAVFAFPPDAHAQVPPAITLDKTVMVDTGADVCGTETALTVGVGTTVRYCYTATNTGDTTLDSHDLTDDQLGTILNSFAYSLEPGASVFLTQTAVITNTVTNTATWTANNNQLEIFGVEATDSLTVTATPPSISLDKTVMVDTGADVCGTETALTVGVGTTVRYCYTATNTGDTTLDSHDLTDDQLGTILNNFAYSLEPGASVFLTQTAVITNTVTNTATWTANNNQLEIFGVEATDNLTVTATPPSITLDKTVMVDTGSDECGTANTLAVEAGTTVRYCYTVTNTGDTPLTEHTLIDNRLGTLLSDFAFVLDPGASTSVTGTAVITGATTNTAIWTAENNSLEIYDIEATDDLTVTIAVPSTTTIAATTTTTTTTTTIPATTTTTTTTIGAVLPPTGSATPMSWVALGLLGIGVAALAAARIRSTSTT